MEGKIRVAPSEERAKNIKKGNREMRKIATIITGATGEGRLHATAGSPSNAGKLAAVGALYGVETGPPLPQREPWRAM